MSATHIWRESGFHESVGLGGWVRGAFEGAANRARIADNLNTVLKQIGEAKFVGCQSLTKQIKDYLYAAKALGFKFTLRVKGNTKLSKPLQRLVNEGLIDLQRIETSPIIPGGHPER